MLRRRNPRWAYACGASLALTDRIGFIASKDGYIFLRPDEAVPDDEGFANLAFGFKGILNPFLSVQKGFGDFHPEAYTGPAT